MRQLTRLELEKQKKLEMLEEFDPSILLKTRQFLNTEISKGIITQQDYDEFWPKESGSFTPVLVTENDLTKNLRLIRPQQVMFDQDTIQKSIGEREGYYMNTLRNRELDIVGMPWGYDIIKGKRAEIGEIRHWGGIPYRKVTSTGNPNKDWQRVKDMAKKPGAKGGEKHEEVKAEKLVKEESGLENLKKEIPVSIHEYNGKKYKKQANGKWVEVSEHGMSRSEHQDESYMHKIGSPKENFHWQVYNKLSDKEHTDEEVGLGKKESAPPTDKPTKTMSPKDIVQLFKNKEDWGDMGDYVSVVGNKLQVVDSFYYGGNDRLDILKNDWASIDGSYYKYFKENYGIEFKLTESDIQTFATGKYKKLFGKNMGMVLIKLEVENIQ